MRIGSLGFMRLLLGIRVSSRPSDAGFQESRGLGDMLPSRNPLIYCWVNSSRYDSYPFDKDDFYCSHISSAAEFHSTSLLHSHFSEYPEFIAGDLKRWYLAFLSMTMTIQMWNWVLECVESTFEVVVCALWVNRDEFSHLHVTSSSFDDLFNVLIAFGCNKPLQKNSRQVQYGYRFWPKFPDNLMGLPSILPTQVSLFDVFIAPSCHIFLWLTLATSFHLSSESSSPSYGLTVAEFGFTVRDEPTHCFGTEDFEHYRDTAEHCTLSGSCSRFYRYTAMDYGTFVLPLTRYSWGECGPYLFRPGI